MKMCKNFKYTKEQNDDNLWTFRIEGDPQQTTKVRFVEDLFGEPGYQVKWSGANEWNHTAGHEPKFENEDEVFFWWIVWANEWHEKKYQHYKTLVIGYEKKEDIDFTYISQKLHGGRIVSNDDCDIVEQYLELIDEDLLAEYKENLKEEIIELINKFDPDDK